MKNKWYNLTLEEIKEELSTDLKNGLDNKDAAKRLKKIGSNGSYSVKGSGISKYIKHALTDVLSIILSVISVFLSIIEKDPYYLCVPCIVIIMLVLTFIISSRTKGVFDRTASDSIPFVRVMREGRIIYLKENKIVPGDIIIVSSGDIIPCDMRLIEDKDLLVLEYDGNDQTGKTITRKKDSSFISKYDIPLSERRNMLYSSSVVVKGRAKAIAVSPGKLQNSNIVNNGYQKESENDNSFLEGVKKLSSIVSAILYFLIFLLSIYYILFDLPYGLFKSIYLMLAFSSSSLSGFYPLLACMTVSNGIFSAERRKKGKPSGVILKNIRQIENIKNTDCIIFKRDSLFSNDTECEYYIRGGDVKKITGELDSDLISVIETALVSKGIYGTDNLIIDKDKSDAFNFGDDDAVIECAKSLGIYNKLLDEKFPAIDHKDITYCNIKISSTLVKNQKETVTYAIGSAKHLLKFCEYEFNGQEQKILSKSRLTELQTLISEKGRMNYRAIAVASKRKTRSDFSLPGDNFSSMVLEGIIFIARPIIKGLPEKISVCKSAGMKLIMVCNEINEADIYLAKNLGIIQSNDEVANIDILKELSADLIRANVPMYNLYQGFNVPQLKYMITTLKNDLNYSVLYLGNELKDINLMNSSNVAFSEVYTPHEPRGGDSVKNIFNGKNSPSLDTRDQSHFGSESLKFISDALISKPGLAPGGLYSAISAISSCKGIFRNIKASSSFLVISSIFRFIVLLASLFIGIELITVFQILFLGMIGDLMGVLLISFEKSDREILKDKKYKKSKKSDFKLYILSSLIYVIPTSIFSLGYLLALNILIQNEIILIENLSTVIFITALAIQFILIFELSAFDSIFKSKIRIYNIYPIYLLFTVAFVIVSMLISKVGQFVGIYPISLIEWVVCMAPVLLLIVLFEITKLINMKLIAKK